MVPAIHASIYRTWFGYVERKLPWIHGLHSSILFPIWHRPYLALHEVLNYFMNARGVTDLFFQQILSECAISMAARYPANLRVTYTAAAATLRLPFWDCQSIIKNQEVRGVLTSRQGPLILHCHLWSHIKIAVSKHQLVPKLWRTLCIGTIFLRLRGTIYVADSTKRIPSVFSSTP